MVISKYKLITQPPYKKGKEAQMTKKPPESDKVTGSFSYRIQKSYEYH